MNHAVDNAPAIVFMCDMDGGEYKRGPSFTAERIIATLLVVTWVMMAYQSFGITLATRVALFYLIVLSFIWVPDLIAKLEIRGTNRDVGASGPVAPAAFRWLAWILILGVPAVWFLFSTSYNA